MSKVSYVPYSDDYAELFAYCNIDLPTEDFGGNRGWYADAFSNAAVQAQDYLYNNYSDENAETFDKFISLLDNYSVSYWSTESPIWG